MPDGHAALDKAGKAENRPAAYVALRFIVEGLNEKSIFEMKNDYFERNPHKIDLRTRKRSVPSYAGQARIERWKCRAILFGGAYFMP